LPPLEMLLAAKGTFRFREEEATPAFLASSDRSSLSLSHTPCTLLPARLGFTSAFWRTT
jgi:hypothetical protein